MRSRFAVRLNASNTDDIEKYFKQKLSRIKFPTKTSVDAHLYHPPPTNGLELGRFKNLPVLKIL